MNITKSTFDFLKQLGNNNNRPWFEENKKHYEIVKDNFKEFVTALQGEMEKHDLIEKAKIFRIYRDVRFSNDKTPYKTSQSVGFTRATNRLRGGYYFQIQPGEIFVGGGFWAPEKDDLKRIREEFKVDDTYIRKIIADKEFIKYFGTLRGDELKSAPKGYDKDHPAIDLIRKKQIVVSRIFTERDAMQPDFYKEVNATFKAMRPLFDYMSDVLTTDLNGESIL